MSEGYTVDELVSLAQAWDNEAQRRRGESSMSYSSARKIAFNARQLARQLNE